MMSRIAPRVQRTSLVSAVGGYWKCMPRSVPLSLLNATLACAIDGLQAVLGELVLAERAREEAAIVLPPLEVDDERALRASSR